MDVKPHKTISEQIDLIKKRGCIIDDEERVKNILMNVNYYRLSSYFLPYKNSDDTYKIGTRFDQVYRNYLFDRKLRNMLSLLIENIEVMVKTRIAYYHSEKYGPLGYLDENNYNSKFKIDLLNEKLNKILEKMKKNPVIIHHKRKYEGKYPLWVIIEFLSFSDVSKMYS